jgi:ABC-type molybdate transport system ATPase subunit
MQLEYRTTMLESDQIQIAEEERKLGHVFPDRFVAFFYVHMMMNHQNLGYPIFKLPNSVS